MDAARKIFIKPISKKKKKKKHKVNLYTYLKSTHDTGEEESLLTWQLTD